MRRVIRIVWNSVALLSLGMAGIVGVLWVAGYAYPLTLERVDVDGVTTIGNGQGSFWVSRSSMQTTTPVGWSIFTRDSPGRLATAVTEPFPVHLCNWDYGAWGFQIIRWDAGWVRTLSLPLSQLFVAAAMLPTAHIVARVYKRRQAKSGHCANCDYDLRASPDRCPECGTLAAAERA